MEKGTAVSEVAIEQNGASKTMDVIFRRGITVPYVSGADLVKDRKVLLTWLRNESEEAIWRFRANQQSELIQQRRSMKLARISSSIEFEDASNTHVEERRRLKQYYSEALKKLEAARKTAINKLIFLDREERIETGMTGFGMLRMKFSEDNGSLFMGATVGFAVGASFGIVVAAGIATDNTAVGYLLTFGGALFGATLVPIGYVASAISDFLKHRRSLMDAAAL